MGDSPGEHKSLHTYHSLTPNDGSLQSCNLLQADIYVVNIKSTRPITSDAASTSEGTDAPN